MIYLDNAASTPMLPQILNRLVDLAQDFYANPAALHALGAKSERKIRESKAVIASFLGTKVDSIILTSGATESINTVFYQASFRKKRAPQILIASAEHDASLQSAKRLEQEGFQVDFIDLNKDSTFSLNSLEEKINDKIALVSFLSVNNETGAINPIDEAIALIKAKAPQALIHIDHTQALGKLPINLDKSLIDFASFSAHKLHGPKGLGFLYVKNLSSFYPLILGGGQQKNLRSGTENPLLISFFAESLKEMELLQPFSKRQLFFTDLRLYFYRQLLTAFQMGSMDLLVEPTLETLVLELKKFDIYPLEARQQIPNILNISFLGLRAETLVHLLERSDIYISSSSACHSKIGLSPVLSQMGLSKEVVEGSVRISFSLLTTKEELKLAAQEIIKAVITLRKALGRG